MKWSSSSASNVNLRACVAQASAGIRSQLGGAKPDIVLAFVSPHFRDALPLLPTLVDEHLPSAHMAGCTAGGVIGGGVEIENRPALSLVAAVLPGVRIHPFQTDTEDMPDDDASPDVWRAWLGMSDWADAHFIVLADPFSSLLEPFLAGVDYAFSSGAKIGGLASGGSALGENALYLDRRYYPRGLVCVALSGNLVVDTIVAQGCRPIGEPLLVSKCRQNILMEVNGLPPLQYLGELIGQLNETDRDLMRSSLFLGLQCDNVCEGTQHNRFLIRNLTGIDYHHGTLAVGAALQVGQLVQFHLRDKVSSAEDLESALGAYVRGRSGEQISGALLFSCVGRGRHLYGQPNHDTGRLLTKVGAIPVGGFFCNGEIGPVGGATRLHGYTSAFGIFRPAR